MKYAFIVILFLGALTDQLNAADLTPISFRLSFVRATDDESDCKKLLRELAALDENQYALRAYRAAITMSLAKFTYRIDEKLTYFYRGKKEIEEAIAKAPNNIEIRFLRLALQDHIPAILLYNDQQDDLQFIMEHLGEVKEAYYREEVSKYLVEKGHCTKRDLE
ncbi:MAG: hypothetical protein RIC15_11000 [Vicingaceae bacterium]